MTAALFLEADLPPVQFRHEIIIDIKFTMLNFISGEQIKQHFFQIVLDEIKMFVKRPFLPRRASSIPVLYNDVV